MPAAVRFVTALVICAIASAFAQPGSLEVSDNRLESGEYYDLYRHEGRAGEVLTVSLASDDFDAYLLVLAPDGTNLAEVDDTPGFGLGVNATVDLPSDGTYTVVVTSAFADELGAYTLTLTTAGPAKPLAPATPAANPLAPAPAASPLNGTFAGDGLTLELTVVGSEATGTLTVGGTRYDVVGTIDADTFTGTFGDGAQRFDLAITAQGTSLLLESGGGSYTLAPQGPGAGQAAAPAPQNPLATTPRAPAAAPAPATAGPALPTPTGPVIAPGPRFEAPRPQGSPVPGIGPRAGYVTGTVFDTQGRPLAGAGVLIAGTTYVQGQRTSFEAVTGADGTYSVRVPDGRYGARAWYDAQYDGVRYSRILHPLSGNPNTEIDSEVGGTIDFQWVLTGLVSAPGDEPSDYYGASINLSYCGLPADAYCSFDYEGFPDRAIAPGGSTVMVTLTPIAPLLDGSQGETLTYQFSVEGQDAEYPYGGAPNAPVGFETGGGGRLVLGAEWEYHSVYLHDVPVGLYEMSAVVVMPEGRTQSLLLGLSEDDVEHTSVRISFTPWNDFSGRSYFAGGLQELDVYIRD